MNQSKPRFPVLVVQWAVTPGIVLDVGKPSPPLGYNVPEDARWEPRTVHTANPGVRILQWWCVPEGGPCR